MRTVKRRIWAGTVCEQLVYNVPDSIRNIDDYDPEKRIPERDFPPCAFPELHGQLLPNIPIQYADI